MIIKVYAYTPGACVYRQMAQNDLTVSSGKPTEAAAVVSSQSLLPVILATLSTCILVPTIISSNFLVIVSICRFRRLYSIPGNFYIATLAVADLLTGILIIFVLLIELKRLPIYSEVLCLLPYCGLTLTSGMSMMTLAAIAHDRYLAITMHLEYLNYVTIPHVVIKIGSIWLYITVISFLPIFLNWYEFDGDLGCFFSPRATIILFSLIFVPAFIVIVYCYFQIFRVARHHARAVHAMVESLQHNQTSQQAVHQMSQAKYVHTLGIVIGVFLAFWLPILVVMLVSSSTQAFTVNRWTRNFLALLAFINAAANPWLYAYRNGDFRNAMQYIVTHLQKLCNCCEDDETDVDIFVVESDNEVPVDAWVTHAHRNQTSVVPPPTMQHVLPTKPPKHITDLKEHRTSRTDRYSQAMTHMQLQNKMAKMAKRESVAKLHSPASGPNDVVLLPNEASEQNTRSPTREDQDNSKTTVMLSDNCKTKDSLNDFGATALVTPKELIQEINLVGDSTSETNTHENVFVR